MNRCCSLFPAVRSQAARFYWEAGGNISGSPFCSFYFCFVFNFLDFEICECFSNMYSGEANGSGDSCRIWNESFGWCHWKYNWQGAPSISEFNKDVFFPCLYGEYLKSLAEDWHCMHVLLDFWGSWHKAWWEDWQGRMEKSCFATPVSPEKHDASIPQVSSDFEL